jgi:hypothetical protein
MEPIDRTPAENVTVDRLARLRGIEPMPANYETAQFAIPRNVFALVSCTFRECRLGGKLQTSTLHRTPC